MFWKSYLVSERKYLFCWCVSNNWLDPLHTKVQNARSNWLFCLKIQWNYTLHTVCAQQHSVQNCLSVTRQNTGGLRACGNSYPNISHMFVSCFGLHFQMGVVCVGTGPFRIIRHTVFANGKVELCKSRIITPIYIHKNPNLFWKKKWNCVKVELRTFELSEMDLYSPELSCTRKLWGLFSSQLDLFIRDAQEQFSAMTNVRCGIRLLIICAIALLLWLVVYREPVETVWSLQTYVVGPTGTQVRNSLREMEEKQLVGSRFQQPPPMSAVCWRTTDHVLANQCWYFTCKISRNVCFECESVDSEQGWEMECWKSYCDWW